MEIKIPSAVLCITASTAFAAGTFVTWNGAVPDSYRVETGLGNETETHGYWYSYNDESEGGESNITYPIEPCLDYSSCPTNFLDPVIEVCQGLCATANLSKGALTKKPYAGVGFNIVGETSFTDKMAIPPSGSSEKSALGEPSQATSRFLPSGVNLIISGWLHTL